MISKIPTLLACAIVLGALSSLPAQDAARTPADLPSPLPKPGAPSPLPLPSPPPKPGIIPPPLPSPPADLPEPSRPDVMQSSVDVPSPSTSPKPGSPATPPLPSPVIPELSRLDEAFKKTSIGKAADENRQRVEIRDLQNRVLTDPTIMALKHAADTARTDLDKRERLRDYYNTYYGEMRHLASSEETKKAIDDMKAEHLKLLDQPRVRPVPGATPPPVEAEKKKTKAKKSRFGATGR